MSLKETTDELIERIAEGDEQAFAKLFDLYSSKSFHYARSFLKSKELCKEVVSDVFLSIWDNRKKIKDIQNIEGYLYTLSKNRSLNYLDKLSRIPVFTTEIPSDIAADQITGEGKLIADEFEGIIENTIKELPEKCRIIFLMSREGKLKHHEIAEILSITEPTVNTQIGIAIKKISAVLKKYLSLIL
ncbi:MAG: RNA polymerase sigma-70 factor [Chloroflexia bacterium]|nr:RNA polymerase sigma-70 factor [Chloroflexia bacterium]